MSDSRVGGVVNVFKTRASAQGSVDKLEEWDSRSLKEFSEDKCQTLQLELQGLNTCNSTCWGIDWCRISANEKNLAVVVDNRLIMLSVLDCPSRRASTTEQKWLLSFALHLLDIVWNTARKVLTNLSLEKEVRGWSSWYVGLFSLEGEAEEAPRSGFPYVWGGYWQGAARLRNWRTVSLT